MVDMQLAVETGSARVDEFAKVAGMSANEFSNAFKEDAPSAIIAFVGGLNAVERTGKSAIAILDETEITETRMRDSLLRSSGAVDVFSESLLLGSGAWSENIALTNEAGQRYSTLANKITIPGNPLNDLGIHVFKSFSAPLSKAVQSATNAIGKLSEEFASQK